MAYPRSYPSADGTGEGEETEGLHIHPSTRCKCRKGNGMEYKKLDSAVFFFPFAPPS